MVSRTNKSIAARWFVNEAIGDLHLKTDTASAVNSGVVLAENPLDWNCLPRDNQPDIGADEFSNNPVAIDVAAAARGGTYLSNAEPNPFQPRNSHTVRHIKNRRTQAFQHHCFGA